MSFTTPTTTLLLPHKTFLHPKRRRFKQAKPPSFSPRCQLGSLPSDFLSLFSYNWIPPAALALTIAATFSPKPRVSEPEPEIDPSATNPVEIGEWILFTSPTPFNRFVFLRCPSILVEDAGSGSDRGRMSVKRRVGSEEVEYQRVCVGTEDGGVVSLDWPVNLGFSEERGMDTTVLVVPGTSEGSMDQNVRCLVCECLRRGLFPVVMNPRGCAGSPLTTPRSSQG